MKFFLDFFPALAFLVALFIPEDRQDGIYLATIVLIVASFLQVILGWLLTKKLEKQYLAIFVVALALGAATLLLQDERFIKWKPTVVFWCFSLAFLGSAYLGKRNLAARLMGQLFAPPERVWRQVNLAFVGFFLSCGFINLFVAFNFSVEIWAMFKLFGFLLLNLLFLIGISMFMSQYMTQSSDSDQQS